MSTTTASVLGMCGIGIVFNETSNNFSTIDVFRNIFRNSNDNCVPKIKSNPEIN